MEELGYRDDGLFGGDGPRDLIDVMSYEISDLGNDNSLYYCIGHYDLGEECVNKIHAILKKREEVRGVEEEKEWKENLLMPILTDYLIPEICRLTRKELKYCLWLCDSPEQVKDSYSLEGDEIDFVISSYKKSNVILDDVGSDGKLYAYEDYPYPVEENID